MPFLRGPHQRAGLLVISKEHVGVFREEELCGDGERSENVLELLDFGTEISHRRFAPQLSHLDGLQLSEVTRLNQARRAVAESVNVGAPLNQKLANLSEALLGRERQRGSILVLVGRVFEGVDIAACDERYLLEMHNEYQRNPAVPHLRRRNSSYRGCSGRAPSALLSRPCAGRNRKRATGP